MKSVWAIFLFGVLILTGCGGYDEEVKLSSRELLLTYDWIIFSAVSEPGQIPEGEPEIMAHVFSFDKENYFGTDYTGEFYELGNWVLDEDVLTLGSKSYPILSITSKELVYLGKGDRIVTRLAIKHLPRD